MRRFPLVAALALMACSNLDVPPTVGLITTLSSTNIRIGDTVTVTVQATNASAQIAKIDVGGCDHFLVLKGDVFTDRGQVVGPPAQVCVASALERSLEPGESFSFSSRWSDTLSAGTYYVEGKVQVIGGSLIRSDPVLVTLHQ